MVLLNSFSEDASCYDSLPFSDGCIPTHGILSNVFLPLPESLREIFLQKVQFSFLIS